MSRRRRKSKGRNWFLVAVAALLLVGIAGGGYYVLKVARARTDPFRQARAARKAGDDETAEALVRSMLEADPTEVRARSMLVQILSGNDRLDEAEQIAKYWLEDPKTEAFAFKALSQIALRRNDRETALRYARMAADRDPAFSQSMILQVEDSLGTPADRERASRAAEALASLASNPAAKAAARLYAAETLREILGPLAEGPRKEALRERERLNVEKAREAFLQSPVWKERLPEAKALMARIDLLTDDEKKRTAAVSELESFLESSPDAHDARSALVRHLIAEGKAAATVPHVRELRDGPPVLFLRAVSALAATAQRAAAIELVEGAEGLPDTLSRLVLARLRITGDEAERQRALEDYEALAIENPTEWALVREAYQQIKAAKDPERALRLLDRMGVEDEKVRFSALLERAVAAVENGDADASDTLLSQLAAEASGADLLAVFESLRRIEGGGDAASQSFIEKTLAAGKADGAEIRLLRAALSASRPGEDADGTPWNEVARRDLESIAGEATASRTVLTKAAALAAANRFLELTGILLGRALVLAEGGGDPLSLLVRGVGIPEEADRATLAAGLRVAAANESKFQAWLSTLGDALEKGASAGLRVPSAEWEPSETAPQPTDAHLQFLLAARDRDIVEAEAYARRIRDTWPDQPGALERLGTVLLAAGKFEEVLELNQGEDLHPGRRAQRIDALRSLKRRDEAIAEARLLVREMEGNDAALMVLSRLLREVDPDAALAAISPVTGRANVDLFRAELLEGRGDEDSAARVYQDLLVMSGNRNLVAWRGLARVRAAQDRNAEFELQVNSAIEAPPEGMRVEEVAQLVLLRAQCREAMQSYQRALDDYERVLAVLPGNVTALNNAAWIMSKHIPWHGNEIQKRREQALGYVDKALEIVSGAAPLHHTRAEILEALGRNDEALVAFDAAIAASKDQLDRAEETAANRKALEEVRLRRARHRLDKADLLESMGGEENFQQARAIRIEIRDGFPRTPEGRRAELALEKMGQ